MEELINILSNPGVFTDSIPNENFGSWWLLIINILVCLFAFTYSVSCHLREFMYGVDDLGDAFVTVLLGIWSIFIASVAFCMYWLISYVALGIFVIVLLVWGISNWDEFIPEKKVKQVSEKDKYKNSILNK